MVTSPFLMGIPWVRYRRTVNLSASLAQGLGTPSKRFRCDGTRKPLDNSGSCSCRYSLTLCNKHDPRLLVTFGRLTFLLFSFVGMHYLFLRSLPPGNKKKPRSIGLCGTRPPARHQEWKPVSSSLETQRFRVVVLHCDDDRSTTVIGKAAAGIWVSTSAISPHIWDNWKSWQKLIRIKYLKPAPE